MCAALAAVPDPPGGSRGRGQSLLVGAAPCVISRRSKIRAPESTGTSWPESSDGGGGSAGEPEEEPWRSTTAANTPEEDGGGGAGVRWQAAQRAKRRPMVVPGGNRTSTTGTPAEHFGRLLSWFGMLEAQYGSELLYLLWAAQHVMKGLVQQYQTSAIMWVYMEYGVSGPQMQIYVGIAMAAWAFKPLIGLVSDSVPIAGYRKAPYVALSSAVGIMCTAALGCTTRSVTSLPFVVACLFGMSLQGATCDLLTEASYSERINEKPEHGPDLVSFIWGGILVGNMVAISTVGWLITTMGPRSVFLACVIPSAVVLFPTMSNYFGEVPMTREAATNVRSRYWRQSELVFLCGLMSVSIAALSVVGCVTSSHKVLCGTAIGILIILVIAFHVLLRPEIAKMNTFFMVQAALNLDIQGATFYFFTNDATQYPAGPHFSPTFFATTMGLVSCSWSVVGVATYARYIRNYDYRRLLVFTHFGIFLLSLADVVIYQRANHKYGIKDSTWVIGSSVASVVVKQWQWLPGLVVMSQLCPVGLEATTIAILSGCVNVGCLIADYLGASLLYYLEVRPTGDPGEGAQFDRLWQASVISSASSLFAVLLVPLLVPAASPTNKMLASHATSATAGSLLSRFSGGPTSDGSSAGPPAVSRVDGRAGGGR